MNQYPFDATPESEIFNRIENLKHKMDEIKIDAIFLTHKPDLYYSKTLIRRLKEQMQKPLLLHLTSHPI